MFTSDSERAVVCVCFVCWCGVVCVVLCVVLFVVVVCGVVVCAACPWLSGGLLSYAVKKTLGVISF